MCDPKVINSSLTDHLKVVDNNIDFGCIPPFLNYANPNLYLRGDNTWQNLNTLYACNSNGTCVYALTLQADANLVLRDVSTNAAVWYSKQMQVPNGNASYFMNGTGQWSIPVGTTYAAATTAVDGLMSAADKIKLDKSGLVSQLGANAISKNGAYVSAVSAATINAYRIAGNSGIVCFTANGINVTTAAGNGAHLFSLSLANGGGKVAGDWYFKPMSSSGTFSNTGAFVASAGNSTTTVLKVYAYGTISAGTYSVSTNIPTYFA